MAMSIALAWISSSKLGIPGAEADDYAEAPHTQFTFGMRR
jgi:hypothetical protein